MASLAELYGTAKTKARQIPANLRESGKGLASWAVDPYGEAQRVMGEYRAMTPEQRQGLVNAAVDLFGGIDVGPVGAIKASHGSPHAFTAFDFSKMGTGEGAQAFGHGGYFAQGFDSPLAANYQQALSAKAGLHPTISGKMLGDFYMDLERKANKLPPKLAELEYNKLSFLEDLEQQPSFQQAIDRIDDERIIPWAESLRSSYKPAGHLYNVSIEWPDAAREAADSLGEHHLLDWDKPLSEQPESVRKALSGLNLPVGTYGENPVGAHAYAEMVKRLDQGDPNLLNSVRQHPNLFADSPELVSAWLKAKGIPGIKYLDQGSRGAGQGTSNYVMFDDRFPNIVTRNGVSITDLLKNR